MRPFADPTDDTLSQLAGIQIFLTLLFGMMLKLNVKSDQTAIDILLVVMMIGIVVLGTGMLIASVKVEWLQACKKRLKWKRSERGSQIDTGGVELGTMSEVEMVHEPAGGRRQGKKDKWSVNPLMISSPADMVAIQTERRARGTNNKNNKETGAMRTDKTDNEGRR